MIPGSTSLRNSCLLSWSLSKSEYPCIPTIGFADVDTLETDVEARTGVEDVVLFFRFSIVAGMLCRSVMSGWELAGRGAEDGSYIQ